MPRSAAKSQADKRGRRSSVQVTPPPLQEVVVEDVIPGRLTKAQWMDMLIQEEGDDTVGEIMEDLLGKVMEGCFKVYIERQLAPFSASWAKSYITTILEQQISCPDEGEGPEESSRTEDTEPVAVTLDTWAQGCVRVLQSTSQTHSALQQEAVVAGLVPVKTQPKVKQKSNAMAQPTHSPKQTEKERTPRMRSCAQTYKALSPHPPSKVDHKNMQRFELPPEPVKSKLLPPLSRSLQKTKVEGKSRTHSVSSSHTTGSLHQHMDYRHIPRLDPSCLPQYGIVPQYEIVDNECTKPGFKKPDRLSKLEPRQNKLLMEQTTPKPLTSSENQQGHVQRRKKADTRINKLSPSGHNKERTVSSGSMRLDTMDLAKGVSFLDPQEEDDIHFLKCNPPAQSTKLRLIQSDAAVPLFSVNQVTAGPLPKVTPLVHFKNCG